MKSKFSLLPICLLILGCVNQDIKKINNKLGVEIPKNAKNIRYLEVKDESYNMFIKFQTDSISFLKFVKVLKLVSINENFLYNMCLENIDNLFVKSLWSFEVGNIINRNKKKQENFDWWLPESNKQRLLYAGFYVANKENKIEPCYKKYWNGRVLLNYDNKSETVYIFILIYANN